MLYSDWPPELGFVSTAGGRWAWSWWFTAPHSLPGLGKGLLEGRARGWDGVTAEGVSKLLSHHKMALPLFLFHVNAVSSLGLSLHPLTHRIAFVGLLLDDSQKN